MHFPIWTHPIVTACSRFPRNIFVTSSQATVDERVQTRNCGYGPQATPSRNNGFAPWMKCGRGRTRFAIQMTAKGLLLIPRPAIGRSISLSLATPCHPLGARGRPPTRMGGVNRLAPHPRSRIAEDRLGRRLLPGSLQRPRRAAPAWGPDGVAGILFPFFVFLFCLVALLRI